MQFAIHMKNNKTGERRIKKVIADSVDSAHCRDFYYGSVWTWHGTEPWHNVADKAVHIGRGYYRKADAVSAG